MRLEELKIILANKGLDSLFLYGRDGVKEYNIEYFADAYPLSACKLVITNNSSTLFVPDLEFQRMKKISKITVRTFDKRKLSGKVGFNGNYLSVNELKRIKKDNPRANFVDISDEIVKLRSVKSSEEISRIKEACKITDKILADLSKKIKACKTEKDVENFILEKTKELCLEPAFPPIVAAGSNAANPHHTPTNTRLKGWCIIDMGVKYKGYCSDITRTWFFGKPTNKNLNIYDEVLEAQKLGIKMAAGKSAAKNIDITIRKKLGKESSHFIHSTGHSVG